MSAINEDPAERARKYITTLEASLHNLNPLQRDTMVEAENIVRVTDALNRYLQDAKFYLKSGKPVTSLASIAYAEGLLDALIFLQLATGKTTQ